MAMTEAASITAKAPARWQDFVQLLKPRVMSLVVFTGLTGLGCAGRWVNPILAGVAILCIAVGAGASASLNMWYDADIDAKMRRTRGRPVPSGRVQGADALTLGVVLSMFSVMLMGMALNWLAAGLLAFTILFYAVVYTVWLKRSTAQNIVIGGLAGALPPVIGWAAAAGAVPLNAWLLCAIIFMWTPPHFWSLSLYASDDYARAGVPMLPVAIGVRRSARYVGLASLALAGFTVLFLAAPGVRVVPPIAIVVLGLAVALVFGSVWLVRAPSKEHAWNLFKFTSPYLALLFLLLALNAILVG